MLTSAPAGRHVRLVPTTASRLAHAALPDRDQAGVGLDQALRAEPGRLERDPNIQAGAIHTLDHPLLHGRTPLVGAPDGASAPHGRRHSPAGAAAFARSPRTTRTPVWQLCTGDHDPALGQGPEALGQVARDDLEPPAAGPGDRGGGDRTTVGAVGEDHLDEREQPARGTKYRQDAVPVLDIGRMDHRRQQQAERVDQDVTLLPLDLLARVVAARIDARPPFSAPLTLWLSTIAAVGLASLPARSRTWTKSAWCRRPSVPSRAHRLR